jgi:hypothetical protein
LRSSRWWNRTVLSTHRFIGRAFSCRKAPRRTGGGIKV